MCDISVMSDILGSGLQAFLQQRPDTLSPEQGSPEGSQECRIDSVVGQCPGLSKMAPQAPLLFENLQVVNGC